MGGPARYVVVHRGPAKDGQIVKVPEKGGVDALRKTAAAKLKVKAKAASLFRRSTGAPLGSCDALEANEALCLCTPREAEELSSRRAEPPPPERRHLPNELWTVVVEAWLEGWRQRHDPTARARITQLRDDQGGGDLLRFTRLKGAAASRGTQLDDAPLRAACREALALACVSRTFHRAVGDSDATRLFGRWFWRDDKAWIPYTPAASWDIEIAYVTQTESSTVAVCEPRQDPGGKARSRHVTIDLEASKQKNLNGRGRALDIIRRPRRVV